MIKKIAMFTDIHFGARGNSELHNQDCIEFIKFFCEKVKADKEITTIAFLGDLFENRSAINVMTLKYAHDGLKMLDDLGLPVYVTIGNHDLYHRSTRKVHSLEVFQNLTNFVIISEPTVVEDKFLFAPFLFKHEYPSLCEYDVKYMLGHFEFKGFVITGMTNVMEHGPDHKLFKKPKYIFSGHFHKRQANDNVIYIGNSFPTNYGDIGDTDRGMCIFNAETDEVYFENWEGCPSFWKTDLSTVIAGGFEPPKNARIRCIVDCEVTYSEAQALKEEMIKTFELREFSLEENSQEKKDALTEEDTDDLDFSNINELVISLISGMENTTSIQSPKLVEIYQTL